MKSTIVYLSLIPVLLIVLASCSYQTNHPNIILFLADDMGYGDPQCYVASSKVPTPNIDKLAANGMRFTDAHSPSSVCSPTRYAILTGRYAWRTYLKNGVLGPYSSPLIEKDRMSLPAMLSSQGYSTACVGKWHLGMQWGTKGNAALPKLWDRNFDQSVIDHASPISAGPLTAGFDYYFGTDVPNFPPYLFIENNHILGMPSIPKPDTIYGNSGLMLPGWKLEEILPTLTTKAVSFIDNQAKKRNPFFLYFASTAPHTPIVPAKDFNGKSKAGPYGDLVHQVDFSLGEIMNALERNGILKNTIVIFTSDNGSPARAGDPHVHGPDFHPPGSVISKFEHNPNDPWRGMKADIWEGGHRVPMIISWPNSIRQNTSNELISSIDIMASIATIIGYDLPIQTAEDSWDFSELLLGKDKGDTGTTDIREALVHHSSTGKFAIRKGNWKMIPQLGSGGWSKPVVEDASESEADGQLYNLAVDPEETNNLWTEEPEIVQELTLLLEKYRSAQRTAPKK